MLLQQKKLVPEKMAPLVFQDGDYDPNQEISISDLRQKFEALGITVKKGNLLARFLIEPPNQSEIIYNENLRA